MDVLDVSIFSSLLHQLLHYLLIFLCQSQAVSAVLQAFHDGISKPFQRPKSGGTPQHRNQSLLPSLFPWFQCSPIADLGLHHHDSTKLDLSIKNFSTPHSSRFETNLSYLAYLIDPTLYTPDFPHPQRRRTPTFFYYTLCRNVAINFLRSCSYRSITVTYYRFFTAAHERHQ